VKAILLSALAIAYVAFFLTLSSDPFTDAPNHLARAAIMKSLWFDPHSPFQGFFSATPRFVPYILPDLALILIVRAFGFAAACSLWPTLTMLALALSVWYYARQYLATTTCAILCSWYLATNYLFIQGFFSFQWGVAAAFLALAASRKKSIILYAFACVLCYGSHLAAFAILAAIVTAIGLPRALLQEQTWTRYALELLPIAALTAYYLATTHSTGFPSTAHDTLADKFGHFFEALFVRQNYVLDRSILALFWIMIVVSLRKQWELISLCALSAAIYFILPFGLNGVAYVDERALPFFYIPLLILALRLPPRTATIAACCIIATANLASLALFLPRQNREVAQFREALLTIPPHQKVLPIHTRPRDGNTYPLRHAGSFYAADRHGYIPYLFSQATNSGPSAYFTDLTTIYRPPQDWYMTKANPDWEQVAQSYDYIVITKPWDPTRIDLARFEQTYENEVATVLKPRRRGL
jgi:hypothetical protein